MEWNRFLKKSRKGRYPLTTLPHPSKVPVQYKTKNRARQERDDSNKKFFTD
jgi:hypothetical protein